MKKLPFLTALFVLIGSAGAFALQVDLGAAGPQNWAVLELGGGNLGIANASSAGFINGNVGVGNGGSIGDSGTPITGNVVTYGNPALNPPVNPNVPANVSGTVSQNSTLLSDAANAAILAGTAAGLLGSSGGGMGVTSISFNDGLLHMLTPGVYNLTSLTLQNGTKLQLSAGGSYIFNISGGLTLNSSQILAGAGLSQADILFNITGTTAVAFSGGLAQESVLNGIILAPNANIQITPGLVVGEIIGGKNIGIASGAQGQSVIQVPDAASTALLLSASLGSIAVLKRRKQK